MRDRSESAGYAQAFGIDARVQARIDVSSAGYSCGSGSQDKCGGQVKRDGRDRCEVTG